MRTTTPVLVATKALFSHCCLSCISAAAAIATGVKHWLKAPSHLLARKQASLFALAYADSGHGDFAILSLLSGASKLLVVHSLAPVTELSVLEKAGGVFGQTSAIVCALKHQGRLAAAKNAKGFEAVVCSLAMAGAALLLALAALALAP